MGTVDADRLHNVLTRLAGVTQGQEGQWSARCPAHDDRHASLSVGCGEDGRVLLHCHAGCRPEAIVEALGLQMGDLFPRQERRKALGRIVATYDYHDAEGKLLFQAVRYDPKDFRQRRPNGHGGWVWNLNGVPRVLYRLPRLLAADPAELVCIAEGEKDADTLTGLGLLATTNPLGAGKWQKLTDDSVLCGRRVAIFEDHDDTGRAHALDVARRLFGRAAEVRIVTMPEGFKDVSDWIAARSDLSAEQLREQLLAAVAAAPLFAPPAGSPAEDAAATEDDGADDVPLVELGSRDPESGKLVLSPRRTLPTARAFVDEFHTHRDGRTLLHYAGLFLAWRDNRYAEVEDETLRQQLQPWLHEALRYVTDRRTGDMTLVDFESNPTTVNAALESIRTYTHVPATLTPPAWLSPRPFDARDMLPCRSLNLHLPTGRQMLPTPALFAVNALDFDYDPGASTPAHWLRFLDQLWGDDREQIELLQEWFGYCLTGDTSQQKMLLLVGPRRSGKGTIARVLTRLIGSGNVCGPTTSSLAGPFGLQPLLGKSLAIVSDARFSGPDMAVVVERLLCISGEDTLTIDRKFLGSVTLKLPTRFVFLTNELPRLTDASGALAGRFLVLRLAQSFYGREDPQLTERLLTELPGILNWAIAGWQRLRQRGRFVQPGSVADAVRDMEDLASPVLAFVRECCFTGPGQRVWVDDLYAAWKQWCEQEGRTTVTTKQTFGRDLAAAVPGLVCRRGTGNTRFYEGVGLKENGP